MVRPTRPVEVEITVRGSRFLARLDRADAAAEAARIRDRRAEAHRDATHHCWARRTWSEGTIEGAGFDAGEPAGTAGRPILGALERAELVQAVCVVSRWFGGTKLGTGGLVRAYGGAARTAVESARQAGHLEAVVRRVRFALQYGYGTTAAVEGAIARFPVREVEAEYGERVRRIVSVPVERAAGFEAGISEASGGGIEVERISDGLAPRDP